jgi:hypothetical protein
LVWYKKHNLTGVVPIIPPTYLKENLDRYFTKTTKDERGEHNQKTFWGYYNQFLTRMNNGTRVHLSKGTPMAPKPYFNLKTLNATLRIIKRQKK